MERPQFKGDSRSEEDLLSYERELRAWEEAKADAEHYDELYKADPFAEPAPDMELKEAIGRFLDDPEFREKMRGPEGLPGMNGAPGKQGADGSGGGGGGSDWRVGTGVPSIISGDEEDDLYLDDASGDVYQVQSAAWVLVMNITGPTGATGATGPQGPQGDQGIQGIQGDPGDDGDDGADGAVWHNGDGAPSGVLGVIGDYYMDTEAGGNGEGDVYTKTGVSTWTLQGNIRGNQWRTGSGAPSIIAVDEPADLYLDTDNGDVYQVNPGGSAWGLIDNITGPTGATGATGAAGVDGNDWRVGTGAPSIIGGDEEGDMYLDDANGDVYQVQSSAWVLVDNITGPTGATGSTGAAGLDGNDWRVGGIDPSIIAGDEEGDLYLNTASGDVFQVQSAAWVLVANITGPTGATGATGAAGVDGNDWRVGTGVPAIIGGDEEGDMYLDDANGDVYQVQSAAWVLVDNITGPTGSTGAAGVDGNDWRVGTGNPSIIGGDEEGDLYLDDGDGDVFQVQSSAWVLVANITGPTGATGADGDDGADGADGADGEDISAVFAEGYGPPSNQNISAAGAGSILDLDTSLNEEPAADWSVSSAGVWTYAGTDTITVMIEIHGTFDASGNHGTITMSIEKNGVLITGSSSGTMGLHNAARREKVIISKAITSIATNDTIQGRGLAGLLVGAAITFFRATGHITILRIK